MTVGGVSCHKVGPLEVLTDLSMKDVLTRANAWRERDVCMFIYLSICVIEVVKFLLFVSGPPNDLDLGGTDFSV